jgi:hypothetical protein
MATTVETFQDISQSDIISSIVECEQKRQALEKEKLDAENNINDCEIYEIYDRYIKLTDIVVKMKFLEELDIEDQVALREIFIKQYLGVHSRLLSNISLITENIYKQP